MGNIYCGITCLLLLSYFYSAFYYFITAAIKPFYWFFSFYYKILLLLIVTSLLYLVISHSHLPRRRSKYLRDVTWCHMTSGRRVVNYSILSRKCTIWESDCFTWRMTGLGTYCPISKNLIRITLLEKLKDFNKECVFCSKIRYHRWTAVACLSQVFNFYFDHIDHDPTAKKSQNVIKSIMFKFQHFKLNVWIKSIMF